MQHKNNWNAKLSTKSNILYTEEQSFRLLLTTLRSRYTLSAPGMGLLRLLLLMLMNGQSFIYCIEDARVSITSKDKTYPQRQDDTEYAAFKRLKKKNINDGNENLHTSTLEYNNEHLMNEVLSWSKKGSDEDIFYNPQQSKRYSKVLRNKRKSIPSTFHSNNTNETHSTANTTIVSTLSWENATHPTKKIKLTPLELERIRQVESMWAMASMTFLLIVLCGAVWYSGMCHNRIRYVDPKDEMSQHSASIKDILRIKAPFLPRFVSNWKRRSQQNKNVHYHPLENIVEYDSESEDELLNTKELRIT